jgi:hypothetical protein
VERTLAFVGMLPSETGSVAADRGAESSSEVSAAASGWGGVEVMDSEERVSRGEQLVSVCRTDVSL